MQLNFLRITMLLVLLFCFTACSKAEPVQPLKSKKSLVGNRGFSYKHKSVTMYHYGRGGEEYWIFEPNNPRPDRAPLIVFTPGWLAMKPKIYGAWIDHIVKRRNIVIFPRYQANALAQTKTFTPNALKAVKNAVLTLQSEKEHVKPDLSRVAFVGHSAGGIIAANLAALAEKKGLPLPSAVMCIEPGKTWSKRKRMNIPLVNLKTIPENVLLLAVVGDRDTVVKDIDAKRILRESVRVPRENKNYITLISNDHGAPPLIADHFAPSAPDPQYRCPRNKTGKIKIIRSLGTYKINRSISKNKPVIKKRRNRSIKERRTVDALDYYGLWKLFDGLTDAAFFKKNSKFALGNTREQRFMGTWSDGVPVKELVVRKSP